MNTKPTAPICIVEGCHELSCLADVTEGMFWTYKAAYCSQCYLDLLAGTPHEIDVSRLIVDFKPKAGGIPVENLHQDFSVSV